MVAGREWRPGSSARVHSFRAAPVSRVGQHNETIQVATPGAAQQNQLLRNLFVAQGG